jgi:hypothetical protein
MVGMPLWKVTDWKQKTRTFVSGDKVVILMTLGDSAAKPLAVEAGACLVVNMSDHRRETFVFVSAIGREVLKDTIITRFGFDGELADSLAGDFLEVLGMIPKTDRSRVATVKMKALRKTTAPMD